MSQMLPPYASPNACMTIAKHTYHQALDELAGYKARVAELEAGIRAHRDEVKEDGEVVDHILWSLIDRP